MSHATNMHGHVNTKRDWMGRRECAAQQGNKKSILMNFTTRQCLRQSKRDKTDPSLQEHKVSARKQRNGSIAGGHKTEVEIHHKRVQWSQKDSLTSFVLLCSSWNYFISKNGLKKTLTSSVLKVLFPIEKEYHQVFLNSS